MRIAGIIPSRYGSSRFPGKPLADIQGKSMVQRVYEQASQSALLSTVIVATDDERIFTHVLSFGGKAIMTSSEHPSGTDRCYEALIRSGEQFDAVLNIQGDEPFIAPEQIDLLAGTISKENVSIATLVKKAENVSSLEDPNKVKVVLNNAGEAMYFSRQAIPFQREPKDKWLLHQVYYLHIGLYAYRTETLKEITSLSQGILEKAESLEQLRWLENGYKIKTAETQHQSFGIDTPEDLKTLLKSFGK